MDAIVAEGLRMRYEDVHRASTSCVGSSGSRRRPTASRAARNAVVFGGNRGHTGGYLLLLLAGAAVTSMFATWCFRAYQRSL